MVKVINYGVPIGSQCGILAGRKLIYGRFSHDSIRIQNTMHQYLSTPFISESFTWLNIKY